MFDKVFVEKRVLDNVYTQNILISFNKNPPILIDRIEDVFQKVHKPYLHKRTNLNVLIGRKEGVLVREAVENYGNEQGKHYFFHHAYNCIYECQYCYLQGYFHSPDLVFFVNHDEIIKSMEQVIKENADDEVWFHGGEFSDNMSLSHYTREWEAYFDFFKNQPSSYLELRTKSINTRYIENLDIPSNVIFSYSLSSKEAIKSYDLKTPSLEERVKSIQRLSELGLSVAIHFDPIIDSMNLEREYTRMIEYLFSKVDKDKILYISVGIVRFSKQSYRVMKDNYPQSLILRNNFTHKDNDKMSYEEFRRHKILKTIIDILVENNYNRDRIYKCMEENES